MRLKDQVILGLFVRAIEEASNGYEGYVVWRPKAWGWVKENLDGQTQASFAEKMLEHVNSGGEIDQTREALDEYRDKHEFHYDFRFQVDGIDVYLETLLDQRKTGPVVTVVSAKLK